MKKYIVILLLLAILSLIYYSRVDNTITEVDAEYINKFLKIAKLEKVKNPYLLTTSKQIEIIYKVQYSVLTKSPILSGLPLNSPREPKQVFNSTNSMCSDRSRVIEKTLRYLGFKTRHVSIYSIKETNSAVKSLFFTKRNSSHAVTEVLTSDGWVLIESNYKWIAINKDNEILSIKDVYKALNSGNIIQWKERPGEDIFNHEFTYIYGLYSRHGKFYPPYNSIPDIEWKEFMYNFTEIIYE